MAWKIGLALVCTAMSCASASAESLNYSKRIITAQNYTWTYCLQEGDTGYCVLKRSDATCPDGYASGGISWTTSAAACSAAQSVDGCRLGTQGC
jgi:hypothetical protein